MTTFDKVLPALSELLEQHHQALRSYLPILINRDLNGRVRLIIDRQHERRFQEELLNGELQELAAAIHAKLTPHLGGDAEFWIYDENLDALISASKTFELCQPDGNSIEGIKVADRLIQEAIWSSISPETSGSPRAVFYSIKGGVGRSTALAASAWSLSECGKRVLVLDLDLESPGISSSLLPPDRQPSYGITDWLVEDLVGNGDAVLDDLYGLSPLSRNGEILVVPAHGAQPGEYISKLGRVWMPLFLEDGSRQIWSHRLCRLLSELESRHRPDIMLIDSRAGIDEVASACVTDLGASRIYLFALDGVQTWTGYRILLEYWRQQGVVTLIRERLQLVGAMLPTWSDKSLEEATESLREHAYSLFLETMYDDQPASTIEENVPEAFNFDLADLDAPHNPRQIPWNQGLAAIQSLHDRLEGLDLRQVQFVFGELVDDLIALENSEATA